MNSTSTSKTFYPVLAFLLVIIFYVILLVIGYKGKQQDYSDSAKAFNAGKLIKNTLPPDEATELGTSGQFEGPQVAIHALEWMGHSYLESNKRLLDSLNQNGAMLHFKGTQLSFDPDHQNWGLPNLRVNLSSVVPYEPEGSIGKILKGVLGLRDKNEGPYRVYRKKLLSDNPDYQDKFIEMQLWLTEFKVRVEIWPDKKSDKPAYANKISYPRWFYPSGNRNTLADLKEEFDNYRYGNLNVVFRIVPNNASWYVHTRDTLTGYVVKNETPDIAIAAILCSNLQVGNEEGEKRIGIALQTGSALTMYPGYQSVTSYNEEIDVQRKLTVKASELIESKKPQAASEQRGGMWNQSQYVWVHFDNIGSWKSGNILTGTRKFADYVDATFILPIFVVGEWDVRMPSDLVKWIPQKPLEVKGFGFGDLIPDFKLGMMGKVLSGGVGVFIIILILSFFFPPLMQIINLILNGLVTGLGKIFRARKS